MRFDLMRPSRTATKAHVLDATLSVGVRKHDAARLSLRLDVEPDFRKDTVLTLLADGHAAGRYMSQTIGRAIEYLDQVVDMIEGVIEVPVLGIFRYCCLTIPQGHHMCKAAWTVLASVMMVSL